MFFIPRIFFVVNVCNQGKTLSSPCTSHWSTSTIHAAVNTS